MFHDEPTIESLDMMGLAVAAVGNHEFDEGKDELLRMQNGGCHPIDGCQGPHPFLGAKFRYLAASTFEKSTGKTVLPAYEIREFDGIPVAFIGLTLKGTPNLVSPVGVADLEFRDEADTVNALVPELKARGVEAIVVLIHEGGFPTGDYNECPGISGPIVDIVKKFDRAVDVVVSGHTHRPYVCDIDGRLVTVGRQIRHHRHRDRPQARSRHPRRHQRQGRQRHRPHRRLRQGPAADRAARRPMTGWPRRSPAGRRARSPKRCRACPTTSGESVLGDIIADAQLAATRAETNGGAVIAFTNPGGVRSDITKKDEGAVTYGDVFASQPFRNQLVTLTLTGTQIKDMLEQQWLDPKRPRILQVSTGFSYSWDAAKPIGDRVAADSMSLNGQRIDPAAGYRVTVNNFLAVGGDGFTVFTEGTAPQVGVYDVDALYAYFKANSPIAPDHRKSHRANELNGP